jgi:hypothetical protein
MPPTRFSFHVSTVNQKLSDQVLLFGNFEDSHWQPIVRKGNTAPSSTERFDMLENQRIRPAVVTAVGEPLTLETAPRIHQAPSGATKLWQPSTAAC